MSTQSPAGDTSQNGEPELTWPPWLEDLIDVQRIRAIVRAVAECAASHHGSEPPGLQHCTEAMAEHFLVQLLRPAAAAAGRDPAGGDR